MTPPVSNHLVLPRSLTERSIGSGPAGVTIERTLRQGQGSLTPIVRDVLITRQEIDGLTAGLLVSRDPPIGSRKFTDWLREAAPWLGRHYLSEVGRHFVS